MRFAEKPLQVLRPGPAGRDAHTEQEGVARWGVPQGMWTNNAADGGHGSRGTGAVRRLCGHRHWYGVDARHHAWTCRLPPAACLCSRGSDCTTRTGRSCRFAGAWVRCTADKPVLGNLDGQGRAAVLRDQLRNPGGLFADEHIQGELSAPRSCPAPVPRRRWCRSAIAAGTASISVNAASDARMERPFFTI